MNICKSGICHSGTIVLIASLASYLSAQEIRSVRFPTDSTVELNDGKTRAEFRVGARFDQWTVMAVAADRASAAPFAVLEDFTSQTGHLMIVSQRGTRVDLPKSLESTWADPAKLYLGHSLDQVMNSAADLLGDEVLSRPGDPDYETVAPILPPFGR